MNTEEKTIDLSDKLEDIKDIIDTLRIYIQQDGGDVEFVSLEKNVVTVRLLGACIGCGLVDVTYQSGLQEILRDEVDRSLEVKLITEENPLA